MQILKPTIIKSNCHKIHLNLGLESYLFSNSYIQSPILYLWQNDKTIVIGRHQNPWKECNLQLMQKNSVWLQRRSSGGGAVYQDLGNHCFTFLNTFTTQDPKTINNDILINALLNLGIEAQASGRNDIVVGEKKVSGSAYQLSLGTKINPNKIALHHGTMLIDVDQNALAQYLTPSKKKLESKGIDSVKSRVSNLKEIKNTITVQQYEEQLINEFIKKYNDVEFKEYNSDQLLNIEEIRKESERLSSWEWLYQYTPQFTVNLEEKLKFGMFDFYLQVESSIIQDGRVFTDCLYPDYITQLNQVILNKKYDFDGIKQIFNEMRILFPQLNELSTELEEWLLKAI
ncbi:unnamed protein product [Paramecium primaurelia]|uniref:lipoate--protein ligase n=1 Tax=Paramecium primaurelia TaxID=5886 RepID=A0A8S1PF35_PARPR|nr:unnamed protein product [Paramecium primaurelia]